MCVALLRDALQKNGVAGGSELADVAQRNVERMTSMLKQLTDSVSVESQAGGVSRAPCDLRSVVVDLVAGLAGRDALRVSVESDPFANHRALGDREQLERVIGNLLTNALKYSAHDAPVRVRLAADESWIHVAVSDYGIGIGSELIARLFDRYYRAPAGRAHASGLGLGLYIARTIVERHGGHIAVTSEVGRGSTFSVALPIDHGANRT